MKNVWLSVVLGFSIGLSAQTFSDSLLHVVQSGDLAQVQGFLEKSKSQNPHEVLKRQIVDDYYEMSYETREVPGNKICFLTKGSKLIVIKFYGPKKKYEHENAAEVKQFSKAFASFFGSKPKTKELFSDTVRYGKGCGFVGADPPERKKMTALVEAKNTKELTRWLQSVVTEKQLYAAEGLSTLAEKGYKLSAHQEKLLNFIRSKKGNYQACNGCIYSSLPIEKAFTKGN